MADGPVFPFLELSREIRDHIVEYVLFTEKPGYRLPRPVKMLPEPTNSVAIFPFWRRHPRNARLDVSITRTCKQLQAEAERLLYGTLPFIFTNPRTPNAAFTPPHEFLERLPGRTRRLIRIIEQPCYDFTKELSDHWERTKSFLCWRLFTTFLAKECSGLKILRLWTQSKYVGKWVETDTRDRTWTWIESNSLGEWITSCTKDASWVQDLLKIKGLSQFDMPISSHKTLERYPEFAQDFLPWLKSELRAPRRDKKSQSDHAPQVQVDSNTAFPFLKLPHTLRDQVYKIALLPPKREIHPYIRSWYDRKTRNIIPLFLTCKSIHAEAEKIVYGMGIYTLLSHKADRNFRNFLKGPCAQYIRPESPVMTPSRRRWVCERLRDMIRHVRIPYNGINMNPNRSLKFTANHMPNLETIHLQLEAHEIDLVNEAWTKKCAGRDPFSSWAERLGGFRILAASPASKIIEPQGCATLDPNCHAWLESDFWIELTAAVKGDDDLRRRVEERPSFERKTAESGRLIRDLHRTIC